MFNKPFSKIDIADIQYLIDNKIEESRSLEYKKELDGGKYGDEFLRDFIAFANASGGYLLLGIEEGKEAEKGKPVSIVGIDVDNEDENKLTLNNIIRDKISPRFNDYDIKYLRLNDGKYVVIIKIEQSWDKPHMINKISRDFYIRNTSGKHAMDISEIKNALFSVYSDKERIMEFRCDRVQTISSTSVNGLYMEKSPKIVLHIIPLVSFSSNSIIPISSMETYRNQNYIYHSQDRLNFDGIFIWESNRDGTVGGNYYAQLYRNGIIEDTKRVYVDTENKMISPICFYEAINRIESYLKYLSENNVDTPIFIFLSLINFHGMYIGQRYNTSQYHHIGQAIDRDIIQLPEIILTNFNINLKDLLSDTLDIIANSFGLKNIDLSEFFDEQ